MPHDPPRFRSKLKNEQNLKAAIAATEAAVKAMTKVEASDNQRYRLLQAMLANAWEKYA